MASALLILLFELSDWHLNLAGLAIIVLAILYRVQRHRSAALKGLLSMELIHFWLIFAKISDNLGEPLLLLVEFFCLTGLWTREPPSVIFRLAS